MLLRSHSTLCVQSIDLFATFGVDGIAEVVPKGKIQLGVIALAVTPSPFGQVLFTG